MLRHTIKVDISGFQCFLRMVFYLHRQPLWTRDLRAASSAAYCYRRMARRLYFHKFNKPLLEPPREHSHNTQKGLHEEPVQFSLN